MTTTCYVFRRLDAADLAILIAPDDASAWLSLAAQRSLPTLPLTDLAIALQQHWAIVDRHQVALVTEVAP